MWTFDSLMHTYLGEPAPMCIFMESCGDYVVVEHNGEAVAPSEFSRRALNPDDRLEIVRIVAGG